MSTSLTTLKIIVMHVSMLNRFVPTYSPSGVIKLANASTVKGTTLVCGQYKTTSKLTVISLKPTPATLLASV